MVGKRLDASIEDRSRLISYPLAKSPLYVVWPFLRNLALTASASDYLDPVPFFAVDAQHLSSSTLGKIGEQLSHLLLAASACISDCKKQADFVLAASIESFCDFPAKYWDSFWRLSLQEQWDIYAVHRLSAPHPISSVKNSDNIRGSSPRDIEELLSLFDGAISDALGLRMQRESIGQLLIHLLVSSSTLIKRIAATGSRPFMVAVDNCMEPKNFSSLMAARLIGSLSAEVNHGSIYDHKYTCCQRKGIELAPWLDILIVNDNLQGKIRKRMVEHGYILPSIIRPAEGSRMPAQSRRRLATDCLDFCGIKEIVYIDTFAARSDLVEFSLSEELLANLSCESKFLLRLARKLSHVKFIVRPHPRWGLNPILAKALEANKKYLSNIHLIESRSLDLRTQLARADLAVVSPRSSAWKDCSELLCPFIFSSRTFLSVLMADEVLYRKDLQESALC